MKRSDTGVKVQGSTRRRKYLTPPGLLYKERRLSPPPLEGELEGVRNGLKTYAVLH
jgi:hypothetical protein